jgi:hypothetical protein
MKEYYLIEEHELQDMLYDYHKLAALEYGGVDNWEWYGESRVDYLDFCKVESFDDLVAEEMRGYKKIKANLDELNMFME